MNFSPCRPSLVLLLPYYFFVCLFCFSLKDTTCDIEWDIWLEKITLVKGGGVGVGKGIFRKDIWSSKFRVGNQSLFHLYGVQISNWNTPIFQKSSILKKVNLHFEIHQFFKF